MNTFLVFASLIGCCLAASVSVSEWESYKDKYGKIYDEPEEDEVRKTTYEENLEKIEAHNARHHQGLESYTLGVNHLSDWSNSELQNLHGLNQSEELLSDVQVHQLSGFGLPESIDWREKNVVTSVKDQGQCRSCWAFGATAAVESHYAIKTGTLMDLSEQQLVDCDSDGATGCRGGYASSAFNYIVQYGQEPLYDYPYNEQQGACQYNAGNVAAKISNFLRVPRGNEYALQDAVANVGPVAVTIDATDPSFARYKGGIYDPPSCSSTSLDHVVLVVGYGTSESGEEYYIVKNSWGSTWGIGGYFLLRRNANNACGVATQASYPVS